MTTAARRKPMAKTPARSQPRAARAKANDALADLDRDQLLGLYREMQMLRKFELVAVEVGQRVVGLRARRAGLAAGLGLRRRLAPGCGRHRARSSSCHQSRA
ncbi:MAG: hypothetical protein ACKOUS_15710 [Alphaproteobacteria bacterium]